MVERGQRKLPYWLHYSKNSSMLTGTPQFSDMGSYTIKLRAECIDPAKTPCQEKISRTFHVNVVEPLKSEESRGSHVVHMHVGNDPLATNRKPGNDGANNNFTRFHLVSSMFSYTSETSSDTSMNFIITSYSHLNRTIESFTNAFETSVLRESQLHESSEVSYITQSMEVFDSASNDRSESFTNPTFTCSNEITYFTSLLLHLPHVHSFKAFEDSILKLKLSKFISRDVKQIQTKLADIDTLIAPKPDQFILTAGPGNVIESMNNSLEVTWHLVCGHFEGLSDYTKVLQHNIEVGRLTEETGYGVIAWFVYTDRPVPRRVKRMARGNARRTATPTFSPPAPSTVVDPTSSLQLESHSYSLIPTLPFTPSSAVTSSNSYFSVSHYTSGPFTSEISSTLSTESSLLTFAYSSPPSSSIVSSFFLSSELVIHSTEPVTSVPVSLLPEFSSRSDISLVSSLKVSSGLPDLTSARSSVLSSYTGTSDVQSESSSFSLSETIVISSAYTSTTPLEVVANSSSGEDFTYSSLIFTSSAFVPSDISTITHSLFVTPDLSDSRSTATDIQTETHILSTVFNETSISSSYQSLESISSAVKSADSSILESHIPFSHQSVDTSLLTFYSTAVENSSMESTIFTKSSLPATSKKYSSSSRLAPSASYSTSSSDFDFSSLLTLKTASESGDFTESHRITSVESNLNMFDSSTTPVHTSLASSNLVLIESSTISSLSSLQSEIITMFPSVSTSTLHFTSPVLISSDFSTEFLKISSASLEFSSDLPFFSYKSDLETGSVSPDISISSFVTTPLQTSFHSASDFASSLSFMPYTSAVSPSTSKLSPTQTFTDITLSFSHTQTRSSTSGMSENPSAFITSDSTVPFVSLTTDFISPYSASLINTRYLFTSLISLPPSSSFSSPPPTVENSSITSTSLTSEPISPSASLSSTLSFEFVSSSKTELETSIFTTTGKVKC